MTNEEDALRFFMSEGVLEAMEKEIKKAVSDLRNKGFQDEDLEKKVLEIFRELYLAKKEYIRAEDIFSSYISNLC